MDVNKQAYSKTMENQINGYELSRDWFDFCFENPEKITPTHTALYFFAIEHCNRLGWKEKFGLPTQMCMDAIGVKNWRTFSKAFNDIVIWGFFKLIVKSKNQYSATVIAIVKNTKANTKALTKAMQKHVQKQNNSIAVIDKPYNHITNELYNTNTAVVKNWKNDFEIYKSELNEVYNKLIFDYEFIATQEKLNPNVDVGLSLEKAVLNFWATEAGWKHKKKSRSKELDWKSTLTNSISQSFNKVYKQKTNGQTFTTDRKNKNSETIAAAENLFRDIASEIRQ